MYFIILGEQSGKHAACSRQHCNLTKLSSNCLSYFELENLFFSGITKIALCTPNSHFYSQNEFRI